MASVVYEDDQREGLVEGENDFIRPMNDCSLGPGVSGVKGKRHSKRYKRRSKRPATPNHIAWSENRTGISHSRRIAKNKTNKHATSNNNNNSIKEETCAVKMDNHDPDKPKSSSIQRACETTTTKPGLSSSDKCDNVTVTTAECSKSHQSNFRLMTTAPNPASRRRAHQKSLRMRLSVNNFRDGTHVQKSGSNSSSLRLSSAGKTRAQTVTDFARTLVQKNSSILRNNAAATKVNEAETDSYNKSTKSVSFNSDSTPRGTRVNSAPVVRMTPPHSHPTRVASARPFGKTEETPYQREITASHLERINQARERLSSISPGVQFRYTSRPPETVTISKVDTTTSTPTPTFVSGSPSPAANGMVFKRQYANPRILSLSYLGQNDKTKSSSSSSNFAITPHQNGHCSVDTTPIQRTNSTEDVQNLAMKISQLKREHAPVKPILKYPDNKQTLGKNLKNVRFSLPENTQEKTEPHRMKELRFLKLF